MPSPVEISRHRLEKSAADQVAFLIAKQRDALVVRTEDLELWRKDDQRYRRGLEDRLKIDGILRSHTLLLGPRESGALDCVFSHTAEVSKDKQRS